MTRPPRREPEDPPRGSPVARGTGSRLLYLVSFPFILNVLVQEALDSRGWYRLVTWPAVGLYVVSAAGLVVHHLRTERRSAGVAAEPGEPGVDRR